MSEPHVARPRGETRQRILDTALRLFAERGYAGTSVRDIAVELGITKAAVHYHFSAKEQIVVALLRPFLQQFAGVVEDLADSGRDPRRLLLGVRDVLVDSGPLLSVMSRDPSVAAASGELQADVEAVALRMGEVLAGPGAGAARRLRAHCALGAFFAGWDTAYRGLPGTPPGVVADAELEVVLSAAIAALGPA